MRVGGGVSEMETAAVAVRSAHGSGSRRAVRWAVENLMQGAGSLVLVHVMRTIRSVPTSGGSVSVKKLDASVVEMYIQEMRAKIEDNLLTFKHLYNTEKIQTLILEGDSPAYALLRYISESKITSLVLGSDSSHSVRKPTDLEVSLSSIIFKHAPDTCNIYVVSANNLVSNSMNPVLTAERRRITQAFVAQEYSSSSSIESINHSCQLDASHPHSQAQVLGFPFVDNVQESNLQGDILSVTNEELQSSSSYLESSNIKAEAEKLRLELENTLSLYNQACEVLVRAQNKVKLLSSECVQEAQKVNAVTEREQILRKVVGAAKEKYLEAEKEAEMARKLLAKETYDRQMAKLDALKGSLEKKKVIDALFMSDQRYRRYTRDDIQTATNFFSDNKMIGEGAYGKVYKCSLDHTLVAVKVVRHEEASSDRKEEFLREVEVLSQLRHPNIVLLVGACPESGCLVYEYMENGSLEDHLVQGRGKPPLPWPVRFRIAFEVACGLAFLHHTKPEPIVHRDLKPGNILLDKNYVSKIGDVGLAKLISDVVPDSITEYRDSVIAGTLFYMDPEYQRTGTLRPKSDLYSFGVIILQLLATCHPNGLILKFEKALRRGNFTSILDRSVPEWPLPEAEELAQLGLKCCSLRCRDRPDLETEVLPVLKRLAELADSSSSTGRPRRMRAPQHYYCPILQELMDNPYVASDGFTYEHDAIKAWLDKYNVSPVTMQRLPHKILTPNHTLHTAIQEWRRGNR